MKCPFRIVERRYKSVTVEEFPECYYHECPFYKEEVFIGDNSIPEYCNRVIERIEKRSTYEND